ncbi:hypothetical protein [Prolixibacter sp. SD074]|jgi:hypothetical protein|uniref:hypothetical protein n=1 Tax=Prolixibacter sp. SD074 TaxID=2652391 RepID=UPI0012762B39|nr:hypothetical protein [Prolixibacter sp. SD074]GET29129.1 hypothetical protein SD074_13310 [Prolixibacter sp. SD074]
MKRLKYQFTLDDMPRVAEYIYQTFQRDHDEFERYSPDFNQEFEEALEERINAIRELPNLDFLDEKVAGKQKKLLIMTSHLRPLLNITELYFKTAKDDALEQSVDLDDINSLRTILVEKRIWEIQSGISRLLKYINQHLPELEERGFPSGIIDDFRLLSKNLQRMEIDLAETIHEKEVVTHENVQAMNNLWEALEDIWTACPEVFAATHQEKVKDYSPEEIKRHIHPKPSRRVIHK